MPTHLVGIIILTLALGGNIAVLLLVPDAWVRLSLGLLTLAVVVWAASRLGMIDLMHQLPADRVGKRRYLRLRSQVQHLLDGIRRLNWMAVDAERGFRSRDKASEEMDRIEGRLKEMIEEIRSTAGQMSPETEPAPDAEEAEDHRKARVDAGSRDEVRST